MPLMHSPVGDSAGYINPAGVSAAFGSLAIALADRDAEVRRLAARDIDVLSNGALLVAHMGFELDSCVRDIILDRLVATRDIDLARPLLGMVRSDDIPLRNAVIAALPMVGEALLPELQPLLGDADHAVRIAAVNMLQGLSGQRAVDMAIATIESDPHVNVCAAAVDILAEAGDVAAIEPLEALAKRFADVPFIAFAVAAAIKRIG
jgi:HEAT repeat protein